MKKFYYRFFSITLFVGLIYFGTGFYLANKILYIDHSCGVHEGSLPNTWSTKFNYKDIKEKKRIELRQTLDATKYHLDKWENVTFPSRDPKITISGWLFNYYPKTPVVIIVHGIFPNGKCKSEPNLIASLLIKNDINALTIDLRNYGDSTLVSHYENLGLTEYLDVLGAFDFLQTRGFKRNQIGLLGISLGASTVIFAASHEPEVKAIWSESSLAEFDMVLTDEINRYGFPNIFGFAVSFAGKILTGIDPTKLSPAFSLTKYQSYFFTHGDKDLRIPKHHFDFFIQYANKNHINAEFWLSENSYHVDAMFKYSEEYGLKMKQFFEKNPKNSKKQIHKITKITTITLKEISKETQKFKEILKIQKKSQRIKKIHTNPRNSIIRKKKSHKYQKISSIL